MSLNESLDRLFPKGVHPKSVLFRVDAGCRRGLSFGHLFRCHTLSVLLKAAYGCETVFAMAPIGNGPDTARDLGERVIEPDRWDGTGYDALVIDLPTGPDPGLLDLAQAHKVWTIVIDDAGLPVDRADVVVNDSILATPAPYPAEARLLLGPDNLILNHELASVDRTRSLGGEPSVLVSFGGSDPTGLTLKVLAALKSMGPFPARFDVVTGPGHPEPDAVEVLAAQLGNVSVHRSPKSLVDLYSGCAMMICAGGRMLYEAQSLSIPCLAVGSTEFEGRVIAAFKGRSGLLAGLAQWNEPQFREGLTGALAKLPARSSGETA